jgi:uncharacterized protein YdaU (DUF1376 family)
VARRVNHYPNHIGDFIKDTLGFNQGAIGAYRLLLDAYYANEESIPAEDVYVIGRGITANERKNVDKALTKFDLRDGRYYHKRVEEELEAYRERSKAGAENAAKRWQRDAKPDAKQMPRQRQSDAIGMLASSHKPVKQSPDQAAPPVSTTVAESPPLAALAAVCVASRVSTDGTKALLHLRQMVTDGTTPDQLRDAIGLARDRKPDPEVIPLAYLAPILADLRAGRVTAKPRSPDEVIAQAMANIAAEEARNATH